MIVSSVRKVDRKDILRAFARLDIEGTGNEGEWEMARCPLAPFKHEKGYDSSPSFGAHIEPDGITFTHCFTCGSPGTLPQLARMLAMYRDDPELREYASTLEKQEIVGGTIDFGSWGDTPKVAKKSKDRVTKFPNEREFFQQYPSVFSEPRAVNYLRRRGISFSAITALGLRYDPKQWRILFPVYDDRTGRFAGASGRTIRSASFIEDRKRLAKERNDRKLLHPKVRDYKGLEKDRLLLGEPCKYRNDRPFLIVEGLFAHAHLRTIAPTRYVRALLGSELTPGKQAILIDQQAPIYWLTDYDRAGMKCLFGKYDEERAQRYIEKAERLGYEYDPSLDRGNYNPKGKPEHYGALDLMYGQVAQFILPYPEGVRDPDNVTAEQLEWMFDNAELYVRKSLTSRRPSSSKGGFPRERRYT